jgi:hypothetical protein
VEIQETAGRQGRTGESPVILDFKIYIMKRMIIRRDLIKKSDYAKKYNINRVTLDKIIQEGKLVVEQISGTDYIRLETR